ncbi:hypothetical protein ACFFRR_010200 [Megaselia abdita]
MFRKLCSVRFYCSKFFKTPGENEASLILEQLNKSSVAELSRFKISEARASKLVNHRTEFGEFKNCEEILNVKGVGGVGAVNNLFESIISPTPQKKAKEGKPNILTIPDTHNGISTITSCSSIRVGVSNISWASFEFSSEDQNIRVTRLENYTFNERKLHIGELIKKVVNTAKHIPESDCYVFENPKIATPGTPGNAEQVNINVQQSQVLAMLSLVLSQRNTTSIDNVFFLKRYLYARLFKLLVGKEVVSTKSVVDEIIGHDQGYLKLDYEMKSKFENLEHFEQEYLRQTLLMGLAFIKLSVFKCPKSIQCLEQRN